MQELSLKVLQAKTDAAKMDDLIREYLPFIKSEISKTPAFCLEYEDKLSLGMLVFMNCVKQYNESRGGFISYTSVCIRNRIIDESRKQTRATTNIVQPVFDEGSSGVQEHSAAMAEYDKQQEQLDLQEEISALNCQLKAHGLSFQNISRAAPKQRRSRLLCAKLALAVCNNPQLKENFLITHNLPKTHLAAEFAISPKTIEKYRRYIAALILIYSGAYPGIRAYIPSESEVTADENRTYS